MLQKPIDIWVVMYQSQNGWRLESNIFRLKEDALERVNEFEDPGPGQIHAIAVRMNEIERVEKEI
jgi:hypothetical protein